MESDHHTARRQDVEDAVLDDSSFDHLRRSIYRKWDIWHGPSEGETSQGSIQGVLPGRDWTERFALGVDVEHGCAVDNAALPLVALATSKTPFKGLKISAARGEVADPIIKDRECPPRLEIDGLSDAVVSASPQSIRREGPVRLEAAPPHCGAFGLGEDCPGRRAQLAAESRGP
jgi:hypothetical protein